MNFYTLAHSLVTVFEHPSIFANTVCREFGSSFWRVPLFSDQESPDYRINLVIMGDNAVFLDWWDLQTRISARFKIAYQNLELPERIFGDCPENSQGSFNFRDGKQHTEMMNVPLPRHRIHNSFSPENQNANIKRNWSNGEPFRMNYLHDYSLS